MNTALTKTKVAFIFLAFVLNPILWGKPKNKHQSSGSNPAQSLVPSARTDSFQSEKNSEERRTKLDVEKILQKYGVQGLVDEIKRIKPEEIEKLIEATTPETLRTLYAKLNDARVNSARSLETSKGDSVADTQKLQEAELSVLEALIAETQREADEELRKNSLTENYRSLQRELKSMKENQQLLKKLNGSTPQEKKLKEK